MCIRDSLYCDLIQQTIESSKQEIVFEEKNEIEVADQKSIDETNNAEQVDVKDPGASLEPK